MCHKTAAKKWKKQRTLANLLEHHGGVGSQMENEIRNVAIKRSVAERQLLPIGLLELMKQ